VYSDVGENRFDFGVVVVVTVVPVLAVLALADRYKELPVLSLSSFVVDVASLFRRLLVVVVAVVVDDDDAIEDNGLDDSLSDSLVVFCCCGEGREGVTP